MVNTLLAANSPINASGFILDAGSNLSSDASCAFSAPGSRNNTDPGLAPLADNGGFTLTAALLPGSPVIDAGKSDAAPTVDQRGFPRPLGLASDIGAYEYGLPVLLQASLSANGRINISVLAPPGQVCWLLRSADLSGWHPIATNQVDAGGTALFHDATIDVPCRFYRAVLP